ncbi:MAG: hypothetical protein HC919_12160 [Oscillatoriales cyanobacterium SM2_2_1]|nr:hypothetical protein [Oscillatoriales cyanobacterium SM2_2_1]
MASRKAFASLVSGMAVMLTAAGAAHAQISNAPTLSEQTLRESQQTRGASPFGIGNGDLTLTDLIHRANFSSGRSADQVNRQQTESLNDAVETFRSQRRNQPLNPFQSDAPKP